MSTLRFSLRAVLTSTSIPVALRETGISFVDSIHTSAANHKWNVYHLCKPPSLHHRFHLKIYYPEKYTIEPLKNDHLAGRDPNTGRVITARIGGGVKHLFHWVDYKRVGPQEEGQYYVEKVLQIMKCGRRTSHIALVGNGDRLRYILATVNMKAGDIIRTSMHVSKSAVLPNEGDAFPLGSLPLETKVHSIEKLPGEGGVFVHAAGTEATILRKVNKRVIVKLPSKIEVSFDEKCMATVALQMSQQSSTATVITHYSTSQQCYRCYGRALSLPLLTIHFFPSVFLMCELGRTNAHIKRFNMTYSAQVYGFTATYSYIEI